MDENNNNVIDDQAPNVHCHKQETPTRKGSNGWFTDEQKRILTAAYAANRQECPPRIRRRLCADTGLSFHAVSRWFQRQRRKARATGEALLAQIWRRGQRCPDAATVGKLAAVVGWREEEVETWFKRQRVQAIDESVVKALEEIFGAGNFTRIKSLTEMEAEKYGYRRAVG